MNFQVERKLVVNELIIKARWFYSFGIFIIGVLTKVLSDSNVNFSFFSSVYVNVD